MAQGVGKTLCVTYAGRSLPRTFASLLVEIGTDGLWFRREQYGVRHLASKSVRLTP